MKRNLFTTEQLKWLVCMKWKARHFQGQSMKTKMEKNTKNHGEVAAQLKDDLPNLNL